MNQPFVVAGGRLQLIHLIYIVEKAESNVGFIDDDMFKLATEPQVIETFLGDCLLIWQLRRFGCPRCTKMIKPV